MKTIALIPARLASTRLPNKPLVDLLGKPLIQWVYEAALRCPELDSVQVATDSPQVVEAVESFGGQAVLTRADHVCGTDRIAEVAEHVDCDLVVNLQGDEPFLDNEMISALIAPFRDRPGLEMTTLCRRITSEEELNNPNCVKVVRDQEGFALYFSRYPIPYVRKGAPLEYPHYCHLGLYAYTREFLLEMARTPTTTLQAAESLEQLKVLETGHRLFVAETTHISMGVDTPEDLEAARRYAARLGEA